MSAARRVVLVVPNEEGSLTGNESSAQRIARGLRARGLKVEFVRPSEDVTAAAARLRAAADPDVVHGFHLRRTGPRAQRLAHELGVPLVMSATGTDLARDVFLPERAPIVRKVLEAASCVLCGHRAEIDRIHQILGTDACGEVAPKGVAVPELPPEPAFEKDADETVVLHVAHIRPVKNTLVAVRAVRELRESGVAVRLVVLGDVLEPDYAREVAEAAGGDDAWAGIWPGSVSHDEMGRWYAAVDVVINTSDSEGGSNTILEAFAHSRAVIASAIPGNIAYVGDDGSRGLLYPVERTEDGELRHDERVLREQIARLAADPDLRARLGAAGRQWVVARHAPDRETDAMLRCYARALAD